MIRAIVSQKSGDWFGFSVSGIGDVDADGFLDLLVGRTDVNCTGYTDVVDAVKVIDVAFRGVPKNFCNPCACVSYPTNCP